jgi:two-component system response regulator YesN
MFRILIVDDEKIVLDAVKYILDKEFPELTSYDTARSGREAIEKADIFNPDIIMMDIRMPGINGIEAIKEIKRKKPRAHFVIVSAYEQFDFAKEAVELNVEDYVLKPIIKNKLVNVLQNIMNKINSEKEYKKKELEVLEKYEQIIPYLEYGFIYSIILGEHYNSKLNHYREILELEESGGYVMIIEAREKFVDIGVKDEDNTESEYEYEVEQKLPQLDGEKQFTIICDALKCKCRCYVGPMMLNKVVAFIYTPRKPGSLLRKEANDIADYVYKKLQNVMSNTKIRIAIGNYQKLEAISKSYDEALRALIYMESKNTIIHINDLNIGSAISRDYPRDKESKLIDQISEGDIEGALSSFRIIFDWIFVSFRDAFNIGKSKLIELFVVIHKTAFLNGLKEEHYENYLMELYGTPDYLKLEKWCSDRLFELIFSINTLHKKKNNRIISNAKEYIYENYNKDITLEEVAKSVAVTPHYFSRLFKEETGENFIEFLTIHRIKKAKKMMDTTNLNIKEICFNIGYTNPNYFSRLFKKVEKVTPTDYMKNSNKG